MEVQPGYEGLSPGPGCPGTQTHGSVPQPVFHSAGPGLWQGSIVRREVSVLLRALGGNGFSLCYSPSFLSLPGAWSDIGNAAGVRPARCDYYL